MRPSKLKANQLKELLKQIGITTYKKREMENLRLREKSFDYIFEKVIAKRGFFLMTYTSLDEWVKEKPGMIEKLRAKGIELVYKMRHVKFYSNGSDSLQSN